MDILDELIRVPSTRSYKRPYLPFTESPLKGPYITTPPGRYNNSITNALTARFVSYQRALPLKARLKDIEDRRTWSPSQISRSIYGTQVTPTDVQNRIPQRWDWPKKFIDPVIYDPMTGRVKKKWTSVMNNVAYGPWWYGFANASKVVICLKRKMRREVMHALGLSGIVGQKSPHFNQYSRVKC